MSVLFDANVWIAARNEVYAPDVFSGVWTRLGNAVDNRLIASPPQVLKEIAKKDDELNQWIAARGKLLTAPMRNSGLMQEVESRVRELRNKHPQLSDKDADYYVVAWGKALNRTVVTLENPKSSKKIPAVCRQEEIECISPLEFMRRQSWEFPPPTSRAVDAGK